MRKVVFAIIIVLVLLISQTCYYVFYKGLPEQIHKLEYRVPIKVSMARTGSDISYQNIGIKTEHESDYYEFNIKNNQCSLRIEWFDGNVTNNNSLYLIKNKNYKIIHNHKWYYSLNKYFTTYKGDTYVVQIRNNNNCKKINENVIKSLKLK